MQLFEMRLQNYGSLRRAPFEWNYVCYHTLDGGNVRTACASRYRVSICVKPDGDRARTERAPSQLFVKDKSLERQCTQVYCRSDHRHIAMELSETFCERLYPNKTTAAPVNVLRNGRYEVQPSGARAASQRGNRRTGAERAREWVIARPSSTDLNASTGQSSSDRSHCHNRSMPHWPPIANSPFIMAR